MSYVPTTMTCSVLGQTSGTESTTYGMIKLDSVNNTPIKIDIGDQEANAAATSWLSSSPMLVPLTLMSTSRP